MALRFNPPPNWPAPPEGFNPPAGWQPDPAWGPAPEGWQLWVEDSVPGGGIGSAPQTASGADAGWAPTQAVPTGSSPVADPTGQSASAPSGDYAASAPMGPPMGTSAPMGVSAPMGASAPFGGSAPMAGSAPGTSPYASSMDYAQSPTPYQNQGMPGGGGGMPPSSWQPVDVGPTGGGGSKSVVKQWWFWAIIVVVVLALVIGVVVALSGGNDKPSGDPTGATSQTKNPGGGQSDPPKPPSPGPTGNGGTPGPNDPGYSMDNPADPTQHSLHMVAGQYATDPNASIDVEFGAVEWNANESLKNAYAAAGFETGYTEPPAGKVYIRVPVTVTYHGQGQFSDWDLSIDYVNSGNTVTSEYMLFVDDEFSNQDMPRDGGTATGSYTFLIDQSLVNSGVFAVSAFYNPQEMYMAAK